MAPGKKRGRWDSSSDEEDACTKNDRRHHNEKTNDKTVAMPGSSGNSRHSSKVATTATTTTTTAPAVQDDDDGGNGDNGSSTAAATAAATATNNSDNCPLHNPLLQGCRSVYDTYDRVDRLSEGSYGIVWKARDLVTREIVALKQIKFDTEHQNLQGFPVTALREINVLMALYGHDNIVSVKEMVVGSNHNQVYMVMECFDVDLQKAMEGRKYPNVLRQGELKGILQQILQGMAYMHSQWFMHRDMKTSNILVHRSDGRVALCDLGLARRFQDPPGRNLTHPVVTLYYRAPELLFGDDQYTPAIDMWSIGCIFGELVTQEPLMTGQGELDQIDKIFSMLGTGPTKDNWPSFSKLPTARMFKWRGDAKKAHDSLLRQLFPANPLQHTKQTFLDGNGYDLLTKMLTLDPTKRITAQLALEHAFFREGVAPSPPNFWAEEG